MAKISDEEFVELERERRHEELVQAVQGIKALDTRSLEKLLKQNLDVLATALQKEPPPTVLSAKLEAALEKGINKKNDDLAALIKTLANNIAKLGALKNETPKTFKVIRNQYGFIDQIVLESEGSNRL